MMIPLILAITSALIYLVGFIPYIYHAFHGKVLPHPFSWTIWATISGINTLAIIENSWWSDQLVSPLTSTLCLFIGSMVGWIIIKKIHIRFFDYLCLALALWVLLLAYFFSVRDAILPSILVDILVLSPTLVKIWKNPESEDASGWIWAGASRLLFLVSLGIGAFSFASFWFWYSIAINFLVAAFVLRRQRYLKNIFHRIRYHLLNLL